RKAPAPSCGGITLDKCESLGLTFAPLDSVWSFNMPLIHRLFRGRLEVCPVACFFSILLTLLFLGPARAQVYTGSITGLVQDPSDAVVPHASVVLTDMDKGVTYSATRDSYCRYMVGVVTADRYSFLL